jgi:hypothetical protein
MAHAYIVFLGYRNILFNAGRSDVAELVVVIYVLAELVVVIC